MRHAAILHVVGRAMLPAMLTTAVILTTGSPLTSVTAAPYDYPGVGLHADSAPIGGATSTHFVAAGASIQDAVDAAEPGDTVVVAAGTYSENVTIDKALTLQSKDGADVTIIDGGSASGAFAVKVTASGVTIDGFTIKTGDSAAASQYGIMLIEVADCVISHNTIVDNWYGILIGSSSHDNTVTHNTVASNQFGIHIGGGSWSSIVTRNQLSDNTYGVFVTSSSNNLLTNNVILSGTRGVTFMSGSGGNTCSYNTITVTLFGVYDYGNTNYVDYNSITSDDKGIYAASSVSSYFRGNTITGCATGFYADGVGHRIYWNNFVDNTVQAQISHEANGWILWYNEQADTGNYWSDYLTRYPEAQEVGETGVYDTPYVIREDDTLLNKDFYPMVSQYVPPAQTWTLSVDADGQGTVEVDAVEATLPYSDDYEDGTEITLTATAANGFRFTGWIGDIVSTQVEITVTMHYDVSVTAVFVAESIALDLADGWNLISVPLLVGDNTIEEVFADSDCEIEVVYTWDADTQTYVEVDTASPTFNSIEPHRAYWVKVTSTPDGLPTTVTISGEPADDTDWFSGLSAGWNMAGIPYSADPVPFNDFWDSDSSGVLTDHIYYWNVDHYERVTGDDDMIPGGGYWMACMPVR